MSTFSQALCVISLMIGVQLVASSRVLAFDLSGRYSYSLGDRSMQYTPPDEGPGSGSPNGTTGTGTR